ncbi:MAG: DNA-binding transcriptional regulator Fis [Gammaproteobacteria bacterium]|nr:DNA-binding transcriptional regulator Fis [Gammaproteobacteria bacterium]
MNDSTQEPTQISESPSLESTDSNGSSLTLRDNVAQAMDSYFNLLDGSDVTDVYRLVMSEVEAPLLESVLKHTNGNQTKAAEVLGLNRGTLRKKLKIYGLL